MVKENRTMIIYSWVWDGIYKLSNQIESLMKFELSFIKVEFDLFNNIFSSNLTYIM